MNLQLETNLEMRCTVLLRCAVLLRMVSQPWGIRFCAVLNLFSSQPF